MGRFVRGFLTGLVAVLMLASCASSRSAAADERDVLSRKLGITVTKKDNIKLYRQAAAWIGVRYRLGGTSKSGVDCSGFAGAIYKDVYGTKLHRSVDDIYHNDCKRIRRGRLREGDLVFFRTDDKRKKRPNHVGVYLKDGKFVHASTSKGVEINSLDNVFYRKAFVKGGRVAK
ncbi:MAG: C40 family peptidase [Salinivirgaceae bacterium]|nr:C40 family peptidase [Salinivirgaceae bacterium]